MSTNGERADYVVIDEFLSFSDKDWIALGYKCSSLVRFDVGEYAAGFWFVDSFPTGDAGNPHG